MREAWQAARAQLTDGAVTDDMRAAVRWAPSSAYWSQRLIEIFGPDARTGIDALEKQLRDAQAALPAASGRELAIADAITWLHSHNLYSLLSDVQNGIDSPATAGIANDLLVRLDRIHAALAAQPAQEKPE